MSATASPNLARGHSTRGQSYSSPSERAVPPPSPRVLSSEGSSRPGASRTPSRSGTSGSLRHVAQRDEGQTNLTRPSTGSRSDSRDRPSRDSPSSRHTHTRQRSDNGAAAAASTPGSTRLASGEYAPVPRRRTTVETKSGVWELGKTIGAGSMGKVKLARHRETHEQVAVKIIPRQSTDEHKTAAERERAEHSKEVRTAREAAIVTLVEHPYICGLRDYVKTRYHWYMLFEFVNGGQMLDYIISHGRLKEKQARKFGRQIASALDYCHRNNIVHRDLKIENILISKTGDIKIIDFGLSNTFTPLGHLKTFCGSLYFAAPELLQAKQYTGPEVDVWSFGIVLYVLVCGKVPFDDQDMPQLHAKIKKGHVEYPPWLSNECRSLIARMLQVDPSQRATMSEIMSHPWITKGSNGPPDNYVPTRRPLQLPLDRNVIRKMEGFDFGSLHSIEDKLTRIVDSEEYQRAVRTYEKKNIAPTPEVEKKRGVFDFYKRRNSLSRDTLNSGSSEAVQWGADPINGFHPLVSVYYLAREQLERNYQAANPGADHEEERSKSRKHTPQGTPRVVSPLTAPEAAYTNPGSYEMSGEAPTGGRSRPRARTQGQDDIDEDMRRIRIDDSAAASATPQIVAPPEQVPSRKESTAANLFRRLSTRRTRESDRGNDSSPNGTKETPPSLRKSFSMRRPEQGMSRTPSTAEPPIPQPELLRPAAPENAAHGGLGRSTSVNSGDFRRRLSKRHGSEGSHMWSALSKRQGSTEGGNNIQDQPVPEAPETAAPASRTKSLSHASQSKRENIQRRREERSRSRREALRAADEREEMQTDDADESANEGGSPGSMKPVFLKGLFSVSTTSSKPFKVIEADIIRVLRQLDIQFSSNGKGGFKCKSAARTKVSDEPPQLGTPPGLHLRKLSFNLMGGDKDEKEGNRSAPRTPRNKVRMDQSDEEPLESEFEEGLTPSTEKRNAFMAAGETSTHVQNDLGHNVDLRFEIFVVKVPLLSLHGIQFKKVDGGTWQYKNMAQCILDALNL